MVNRRRDISPPYEVMRQVQRESARREQTAAQQDQQLTWRQRAARPMVLRVPQGYAVVVAVVAVGLLILAYQVGHSRGNAAGAARQQADVAFVDSVQLLGLPMPDDSEQVGGPVAQGRASVDPDYPDRRRDGLNYLVVAFYPLEEARRLAGFLGQHGVEAAIIPGNNEWFHVVDMQGFAAGQLRQQAYRQRVQQIRQLGRLWRQQHRGPTDLSDLWPQKYQGGAAAPDHD